MNAFKKSNNPLLALQCFGQALVLIKHPDLRKFLLIPLLINIVLFSAAFTIGYYSFSSLLHSFIPDWLAWLDWLLWPLFFISFLVFGFFSFTLLANLIAAPYYNRLSAKTWQIISGASVATPDLPWHQVFFGELQRLRYLLLRVLPLLVLFVIPVLNLVSPLLWTILAAWGIAMEYIAYPLENRGQLFAAQQQFLKQERWGMLSLGGLTSLGLGLPVINLMAAPLAVIAATVYVQRLSLLDQPETGSNKIV